MTVMWGDECVNWPYCGNHFKKYTSIKSSHCVLYVYTILNVNCNSITLGKNKKMNWGLTSFNELNYSCSLLKTQQSVRIYAIFYNMKRLQFPRRSVQWTKVEKDETKGTEATLRGDKRTDREETWKVNQYELARGGNSGEEESVLTPKGNEKHKRPAMQCDMVQAGPDGWAATCS